MGTRLCAGFLERAQSREDHLTERGGIFAQHRLCELCARRTDFLRRFPRRPEVGAIEVVEHPRAFCHGAGLVDAAWV